MWRRRLESASRQEGRVKSSFTVAVLIFLEEANNKKPSSKLNIILGCGKIIIFDLKLITSIAKGRQ